MLASLNGHCEVAKLLLEKGAGPNMWNNNGVSSLMLASQNDHCEVAKLLLERGARPNMQDNDGVSSLMLASHNGHCEVAELLLEKGAKPNMQDNDGFYSFMLASLNGHCEVAKLLLENGVEPNIQTNRGVSAFMGANISGNYKVSELLLDNCPQLNIELQDDSGFTALHYSILMSRGELVKLLLARGAQPNILTNYGESGLMIASRNGNYEMTQILLENRKLDSTDLWLSLKTAASSGHSNVSVLLFEKCVQVIEENLRVLSFTAISAYPEILFYESPIRKSITHVGATIVSENTGISMSIPENSLSPEDSDVDMLIHPCFSGPFELPAGYHSASPAYLIETNKRVKFLKDVTIGIHHYASLTSEDDCEEMAFLSAKLTPQYRLSGPVYIFDEVKRSKGIFTTESQIGEIALRHFCLIKAGKRKREDPDNSHPEQKRSKGNSLYSARLYWNLSSSVQSPSAVFCMSLSHPLYIEVCDSRIVKGYTGMSTKGEARCVIEGQMTDDIELSAIIPEGWNVMFDRRPTKIKRREIDVDDVKKCPDYPPRFSIFVHQTSTGGCYSALPELLIQGLDGEDQYIKLVIPSSGTRFTSLSSDPLISDSSAQSPADTSIVVSQSECSAQSPSIASTPTEAAVEPINDHQTLNRLNVLTELVEINEWESLGLVLGVDYHEIQKIQQDNPQNTKKCLREMVDKLLMKAPGLSWTTLCEALRHVTVSRIDIAEKIEKKYNILPP